MKISKELLRLYAVTDRTWLDGRSLEEVVKEAVDGGVTLVQLREKELSHEEIVEEAKRLLPICHSAGVPLLIDDDVRACLESGADGVHVGQDDMAVTNARVLLGEGKIIGATAHNLEEALKAEALGADYLGCGAAFGSATKKDAKPIDRNEYRTICSAVNIPVCAIGGINKDNVHELFGNGLAGAAIVSGIFAADDISAACRELYSICSGFCS